MPPFPGEYYCLTGVQLHWLGLL